MGKVLTLVKIFPEENTDVEQLAEKIKREVKECNSVKIEDYVYGMKVITASFVCEDSEGKDFEEVVSKMKGVSSARVDEIGLV